MEQVKIGHIWMLTDKRGKMAKLTLMAYRHHKKGDDPFESRQ